MGDKKKKNNHQAAIAELRRELNGEIHERADLDEAMPVFESTKEAVDYLLTRLADTGCTNADDAAERLLPELMAMPDESRRTLMLELLKRMGSEANVFPKKRADIFELAPDFMSGGYPYKNRYPAKLYEKELFDLQVELLKMQEHMKKTGGRMIIIFEGRDTAGKGGTIRRFVENLNPRGARIVALSKPSDVERGQWYFQRYVTQLPNPGEICFFDRSWYNRAVVEPVMGFCRPDQTELFLKEVQYFEQSLVNHGIIFIKLWLSISQEEQLRRFHERKVNPLKHWKLSPVDLASIDKWDDYTEAARRMFQASNTADAPWLIIRNEDKRRGRINAIRAVLNQVDYENKNEDHIGRVDPLIVGRPEMLFPGLHLEHVKL